MEMNDMKKLFFYIQAALLTVLSLGSCSENETPVYDTSLSALHIWVGREAVAADQVIYNYSYTMGVDSVMFYARVMGLPADHDRQFTLEAYDGSLQEAAGSYTIGTYTIPAGEISGSFPIYFNTAALSNPNAFAANDGELHLRLAPNSEFETGATELSDISIVLRNYLSKPEDWDAATYPNRPYSGYFGAYSKVKYQFMIQTLGLVDFHISWTQSVNYDESTNTVSDPYAKYLNQQCQVALAEYNSTHSTPLTDENGLPVTF